jgi:hypothetical protein
MRGAGQRESLRNWKLARRINPFQREEELQRVAIVKACLELYLLDTDLNQKNKNNKV